VISLQVSDGGLKAVYFLGDGATSWYEYSATGRKGEVTEITLIKEYLWLELGVIVKQIQATEHDICSMCLAKL
jgi:hypothetical protein